PVEAHGMMKSIKSLLNRQYTESESKGLNQRRERGIFRTPTPSMVPQGITPRRTEAPTIGAKVPIEHKLVHVVDAKSYEGQRHPYSLVEHDPIVVYTILLQDPGQTPSLDTTIAMFTGTPPGAFKNPGASASNTPDTIRTNPTSISPKLTIRPSDVTTARPPPPHHQA
ncbi:hypothetical protein U1Q18_004467, partial [Sarracenia purpurea var. burkii]